MLDILPYEVFLKVIGYVNIDAYDKKYPDYIFRSPPFYLKLISQVSRKLRSLVMPLIIRHYSLLRDYETQFILESERRRNAKLRLDTIGDRKSDVRELEIDATSFELFDPLEFKNVRSLKILGTFPNSIQVNSIIVQVTRLEHLVIDFDGSSIITIPSYLKRLDILIESQTALRSLSIETNSELVELNITTKGISGLLYTPSFSELLAHFKLLKSLSIRKRGTTTTLEEWPYLSTSNALLEFFKTINKLKLDDLTLDINYILSCLDQLDTISHSIPNEFVIIGEEKHKLAFTMIEKTLAGPFSKQHEQSILDFLLILNSSYSIISLKLVYGLQTELQSKISLYMLQQILIYAHRPSLARTHGLRSIETLYTLMAWNIREDTQLIETQKKNPYAILSFEKDYNFAPNYKRLEKHTIERFNSGYNITEVNDESEVDYKFWSQEVLINDLLKFTKRPKRSNIWD